MLPLRGFAHGRRNGVLWGTIRRLSGPSKGRSSVFLQPASVGAKTAPVLIGVAGLMEKTQPSVGYFRVVEERHRREDVRHSALMQDIFNLDVRLGLEYDEATKLLEENNTEVLYELILDRFFRFQKNHDFVIVEGYNLPGHNEEFNYELNMSIAKTIGSPVVLVDDGSTAGETVQDQPAPVWTEKSLQLLKERVDTLKMTHSDLLGVVVNRLTGGPDVIASIRDTVQKSLQVPFLGSIPFDRQLLALEMQDMVSSLDAKVISGEELLENSILEDDVRVLSEHVDTFWKRLARSPVVAMRQNHGMIQSKLKEKIELIAGGRMDMEAMLQGCKELSLEGEDDFVRRVFAYLDADKDGFVTSSDLDTPPPNFLVVTAKDRLDLVFSLLVINSTERFRNVFGGIILAGQSDATAVKRALADMFENSKQSKMLLKLPILETDLDAFEVVDRLDSVPRRLRGGSAKVERSKQLFEEHIDTDKLVEGVERPLEHVSVKMFMHTVSVLAKGNRAHIVLTDGDDERILLAAHEIVRRKLARLTLIGDNDIIRRRIIDLQLGNLDVNIVQPHKSPEYESYVEYYLKYTNKSEQERELARDTLRDGNWFGTTMVKLGDADGLVSGIRQSTFDTIRPAMELLAKPGQIISSVFYMCLEKEVLVYGDCALNANPSAEVLAQIVVQSAQAAEALKLPPRVAVLSYATGDSNTGPEIDKVIQATKSAQERRPDLPIFGPTQYDAAVDPVVAKTKVKGDSHGVAGRANVLIFPDLNTGNNTYKAVQQSTGASAIGPCILGLNYPIMDISRGATVEDIVNTIAVASALVKREKGKLS